MTLEPTSDDLVLEREASLYSRYLVDREPSPEIVGRFVRACHKLGMSGIADSGNGITEFCISHPWSIPFLDAASGLLRPHSPLRKKIYIMAAVLEASTQHTEDFLPSSLSRSALLRRVIVSGIVACVKMVIGIPMLLIVGGRGRD